MIEISISEAKNSAAKKWSKPLLIVLVRGRIGENVLLNCKTLSPPLSSTSHNTFRSCEFYDDTRQLCTSQVCNTIVSS